MLETQVKGLCKAVELGTTSVTEAKDMLDKVALMQSTAGGGDRPKANELFTEWTDVGFVLNKIHTFGEHRGVAWL